MNPLTKLVERLRKIGVEIECIGNYPWIYLTKVNGKRVIEKFRANHGFTLAFAAIKPGQETRFTDIEEIFKIIRKYL